MEIIDLFSRRVVGWVICNRILQNLALRALSAAIAVRRPPPGFVHHADRPIHGLQANREWATGSQYCAHGYQKLLRKHRFKVSMGGKGNCYDNSDVESFFKSLKAELVCGGTGKPADKLNSPSYNTSTASIARAENTQLLAGNQPWPSNKGPHK